MTSVQRRKEEEKARRRSPKSILPSDEQNNKGSNLIRHFKLVDIIRVVKRCSENSFRRVESNEIRIAKILFNNFHKILTI